VKVATDREGVFVKVATDREGVFVKVNSSRETTQLDDHSRMMKLSFK
jgi:hypothetical protein